MISFMSDLMGTDLHLAPARQVFRSVVSSEARIAIMRSLLEEAEVNRDKDASYDEILDEFASLNKIRNAYAHGLWSTSVDEKQSVWLEETSTDPFAVFFAKKRRVSLKELIGALERMSVLIEKIYRSTGPQASRPRRVEQPDEADPSSPLPGRSEEPTHQHPPQSSEA